jgi:hypothetical protein
MHELATAATTDRPRLTVNDVMRTLTPAELVLGRGYAVSRAQLRAHRNLSDCHTAAFGGHLDRCGSCSYERPTYNGCRDRHCPSCQGHKGRQWMEARAAELLPVPYFHVVFTVPKEISDFALGNKKVVYEILFKAVAETLREVGARRLHAEIGCLAVLHTWSQVMLHHPHIHCVIPGGGLSPDGQRWVATGQKFFLPVAILRRVFRAKFLGMLKRAYAQKQFRFAGAAQRLAIRTAFHGWLGALREKRWVVYAKAPFGSPERVLKYLARYTHKVAIANSRLLRMGAGHVTFRYRDRKLGNVQREMTLTNDEFVRRFLLHTLPRRLKRIRHYGFLANACRTAKLIRCRQLLGVTATDLRADDAELADRLAAKASVSWGGL